MKTLVSTCSNYRQMSKSPNKLDFDKKQLKTTRNLSNKSYINTNTVFKY